MESLGARLKRGREEKNISLDEVVQATKINKAILTAIENDESAFFPPLVFMRGFVRSYARCVGLDEKELLDLCNATCASKKEDALSEELKVRKKIKFSGFNLFLILVVSLAILFGYQYFFRNHSGNNTAGRNQGENTAEDTKIPLMNQTGAVEDSAVPPGTQTAPSAAETQASGNQPSAAPLSSDGKTPAVAQPSASSSPALPAFVRMQAKCYSTTWIGYVIDNGKPSQVFLFPGDEFSWEWQQKLEVKLGNAGGIKITVNGVPLKPLGKEGEVLSVVFGRDTVALRGKEPQDLALWKEEAASAAEPHSQSSGVKEKP